MEEQKVDQETNSLADVDNIIRNHVLGSMGVGLIPIPVVDLVALTGIQLNMIRKIAKIYDVPFSENKGKSFIATIFGCGLPVSLGNTVASLIKSVPIIGQTSGSLAMPIVAGASTYALGKVFEQHFAYGGTFLDFDSKKARETYKKMFQKGKDIAEKFKEEQNSGTNPQTSTEQTADSANK